MLELKICYLVVTVFPAQLANILVESWQVYQEAQLIYILFLTKKYNEIRLSAHRQHRMTNTETFSLMLETMNQFHLHSSL
jgi:hypothetical protein